MYKLGGDIYQDYISCGFLRTVWKDLCWKIIIFGGATNIQCVIIHIAGNIKGAIRKKLVTSVNIEKKRLEWNLANTHLGISGRKGSKKVAFRYLNKNSCPTLSYCKEGQTEVFGKKTSVLIDHYNKVIYAPEAVLQKCS